MGFLHPIRGPAPLLASAILLSAVGLEPSPAYATCAPRNDTFLATDCAVAWGSIGEGVDFSPWASWRTASSPRRRELNPTTCSQVDVRGRRNSNGMIPVRCGPTGEDLWINERYLACSPDAHHDDPFGGAAESIMCPGLDEAGASPAPDVLDTFLGSVLPAMTDLQSQFLGDAQTYTRKVTSQVEHDMEVILGLHDFDSLRTARVSSDSTRRRHAALWDGLDTGLTDLRNRLAAAETRFGPHCGQATSELGELRGVQTERTCELLAGTIRYFEDQILGPIAAETAGVCPADSYPASEQVSRCGQLLRERIEGKVLSRTQPDNDDLYLRYGLFYALPETQRNALLSGRTQSRTSWDERGRVKFIRQNNDVGVTELHNGYVWGGSGWGTDSGGGVDCSDFMGSLLGVAGRNRDRGPRTIHFAAIARYLIAHPPNPDGTNSSPASGRRDMGQWHDLAGCFEAVDLNDRPFLMPSDILVNRWDMPGVKESGHIVIVESFDPVTREARTIEAAGQEVNTVGQYTRPIFEPACGGEPDNEGWDDRPARAGLTALRFRSPADPSCPLDL